MKIVMSPSSMWPVKTLLILACFPGLFAEKTAPKVTGVIGYLEKFGYLPSQPSNVAAARSEESVGRAISALQSFMGLNVTGTADEGILGLIKSPRCGVKDIVESNTGGRSKRFAHFGQRWQKQTVTYGISQYSNKLHGPAIDQTIDRAFAVWAEYVPLNFLKVSRQLAHQADIEIRFERGFHADEKPFDGPGEDVGHGFYPGPGIGGDVHFDEDEDWTIGASHRMDFFQVAVHEIGHALGLDHSNVPASIMAPGYRPYMEVKLDRDDIAGIKSLYGNRGPVIIQPPQLLPPTWPGSWRLQIHG